MEKITLHIEAILFSSDAPVSLKEIKSVLARVVGMELSDADLTDHISIITEKYHTGQFAFELVPIANGFQFLTKPEFHGTLSEVLKHKLNKKLSTNSLETLAIVAYKQPISKSEIEQIRGVNCDYTIQKLLEKDLIVIAGRSDTVGKPLLYATSNFFMNYFGISSVNELPKLRDMEVVDANSIGVISEN